MTKPELPNIFLTNLRSICNKFDDLKVQIITKNPDVVICTESWLKSDSPIEAFGLSGFSCYRTDRENDSGRGGVIMWIRNNLQPVKLSLPTFQDAELCCIRTNSPRLIIVGAYFPPGMDSLKFRYTCDRTLSSIDEHLNAFPFHRLIVAGDFNRYDKRFLTSKFSLTNIVNSPTRKTAILDFILVDKCLQDQYDKDMVLIGPPIGSSDHNVVLAKSRKPEKRREVSEHVVFDLRESHVLEFEQRFLSNDFTEFYLCSDIDMKCDLFYEYLNDAMKMIPRRRVFLTSSDAAWMTPLVKLLIDRRWDAFRRRDWNLYKILKIKVRNEIFKAKVAYFKEKSQSVKGLWSFINMERGSSSNGFSLSLSSTSGVLANDFNEHFCSVMNDSATLTTHRVEDDNWFPVFGVEDVWRILSRLRPKATGSDEIPTLLYKKSAVILAEPILNLIVLCIRQRKVPSKWKIADVVPIPKSSNASIADSRPISLLPIPAKILEKILLNDLRPKFSQLLGDSQFGIRKKSSTSHAIIAAHESLTSNYDNPEIGATIFLSFDFSKAFDRILHCDLIAKAKSSGLPLGFVSFLIDYLANRQQRVRFLGCRSQLKDVCSGVPQGSILGPYLFGLYISSLQPQCHRACLIKYVDDVCLSFGIRINAAREDIFTLSVEIDNVSRWSAQNSLTLNQQKTSGLINYRGHFRESFDIESLFPSVNFSDSVKFLGVFIDNSFGWKNHVDYIEKKCAQRIYILRRLKAITDVKQFQDVYNSIIRSLMEYACPAFIGLSNEDSKRLQRIQDRCLKMKGIMTAVDLSTRRRDLSVKLFSGLPNQETFISKLVPPLLSSGRYSVPFCRTTTRRNSFMPKLCIMLSRTFYD